jgi:linoleoyl-CoA desaturase
MRERFDWHGDERVWQRAGAEVAAHLTTWEARSSMANDIVGELSDHRYRFAAEPPKAPRPAALSSAIRPTDAEIARARRRLHVKAGAIAALGVTSYGGLVIADLGLPVQIACLLALAVAVAAVGTGIMHDANHGAFSRSRRGNRLVAYSADLMGASSWVWRFKHNTLHHTSTNVVGVDSDIDQLPFARLAPQQPWRPWHRYQHLYMWVLYGFLAAKWFAVSDINALIRGGFGQSRFPKRPRAADVALLIAGKLAHLSWAILFPLTRHPWWGVLAFYLAGSWLVGFILAMVFQLAHCTDEVEFLGSPGLASGEPFELRQLRTTADIRCRIPIAGEFVRWLMGGLDHQIEHHLAPRVPHTLYPQMAVRLQALCAERNIPYHVHPSLSAAIAAHGRWLKHLARPPAAAVPLTAESTSEDRRTLDVGA